MAPDVNPFSSNVYSVHLRQILENSPHNLSGGQIDAIQRAIHFVVLNHPNRTFWGDIAHAYEEYREGGGDLHPDTGVPRYAHSIAWLLFAVGRVAERWR